MTAGRDDETRSSVGAFGQVWRALGVTVASIRAHPFVFLAAVIAVVALNLLLPPLVLSIVRKPFDYFSLNPWLHNVPSWFLSSDKPFGEKLGFVWSLALLWFLASGPFTPDWGYTVMTSDLARWILMGVLFGTYFALWIVRREQLRARLMGSASTASGAGGVGGALLSVAGFSTMPCSVAGCGAPVLPILGLAFTGLSSGAVSLLSTISQIFIWVVLVGIGLGIVTLAYKVSGSASRVPVTAKPDISPSAAPG